MSQVEPKLKQKRRPRRNHAATVRDLALFCKVNIEVLSEFTANAPHEGMAAQIRVYTQIAKMLEGNGGK